MGTSIKLDENNDIAFNETGLCEFATGAQDFIQAITVELSQNLKQWVLNEGWGTPWLKKDGSGLLQGRRAESEIIKAVIEVILKYEVDEVISVTVTDGTLTASIKINGNEEVIQV